MAKKKASRKAASKQPKQQKQKPEPLDYLCALILVLTERGIMRWYSGGGADFISHISVICPKDGPLQILIGDVKPWTRKAKQRDPAFEKRMYELAMKAAQPNIEKEAAELEQKAAKLRAEAKGRRGRS